ncbi:MAG: hypothetical protein R3B84_13735 [Zavarzinella sp.]
MANFTKATKRDLRLLADDGEKRGPLTIYQLAFHPSQNLLFGACSDRRLACWDLDGPVQDLKKLGKANLAKFICPHDLGWIRSFCTNNDGSMLLTGGSDRTIRQWQLHSDHTTKVAHVQENAHVGWVEALALSTDGKRLLSAGADQSVALWELPTWKLLKRFHEHKGYVRCVTWTHDAKYFFSAGEDGKLFQWDAKNTELLRTFEYGEANDGFGQTPALSGIHGIFVSSDDKWLAVAGAKSTIILDVATGNQVAGDNSPAQVTFSPTGAVLAKGSDTVQVLNYEDSKFKTVEMPKNAKSRPTPGIPGKVIASIKLGGFSRGLAFHPNGRTLACGKDDGTVELWDLL